MNCFKIIAYWLHKSLKDYKKTILRRFYSYFNNTKPTEKRKIKVYNKIKLFF